MNTEKIYERITDVIIEMLEKHKESDYSSAWYSLSGDSVFAQNCVSKHTYSGINQLMLQYLRNKYNYSFNKWMTFKQLSTLGGRIQKGSKSAMIVYKSHLYLDADTGKNITSFVLQMINSGQSIEHLDYQKRGYLKSYLVFNISQIDNLPDEFYKIEELEKLTEFEKDERAEYLIKSTGADINYSARNVAHYCPNTDMINMPERKQFVSKEAFYSVIFHEISHFSGHKSRLNRNLNNEFSNSNYAFEELISELSSAYINAYLGFESRITNNVDYIKSWLSVMKNDKKFIVSAASQAQKASNYILEFAKIGESKTA